MLIPTLTPQKVCESVLVNNVKDVHVHIYSQLRIQHHACNIIQGRAEEYNY